MLKDIKSCKEKKQKLCRFIGIYENKTKQKYDLDILAAAYLHALKKEYERNEAKGIILRDGAFVTTLADMARFSKIPLYYQEKAIQELESRRLIEYDPFEFDKYDESADACVMFKLMTEGGKNERRAKKSCFE